MSKRQYLCFGGEAKPGPSVAPTRLVPVITPETTCAACGHLAWSKHLEPCTVDGCACTDCVLDFGDHPSPAPTERSTT